MSVFLVREEAERIADEINQSIYDYYRTDHAREILNGGKMELFRDMSRPAW
jgi:hypothetical protein